MTFTGHTVLRRLLVCTLGLLLVAAGCTNQQLPPRPSYVASALAPVMSGSGDPTADGTAGGDTSPSPDDFVENFTDPQNVVEGFLRAARTNDIERLSRTLAPDADLRAILYGGTEGDDLPLLPGVPDPSDTGLEAELARLDSEPWRWSVLRARIWLHTGIGPVVRTPAPEIVRVSLVPAPDHDYHLRFQLVRTGADGPWAIQNATADYERPTTEGSLPHIYQSKLEEAGRPESIESPAGLGEALLDRTAWRALLPGKEQVWKAMMPASVRDRIDAEAFNQTRNQLMARLFEYAALQDARCVGAYVERSFRLVDADSGSWICVLRVLVEDNDPEGLPRWSVRMQLRSFVDAWMITAVDRVADRKAWPPHAEKRAQQAADEYGD